MKYYQLRELIHRLFLRRMMNHHTTVVKAIGYQIFSSIATFLVSFALTGNTNISMGISILDFFGKSVLYFLYEIGWNNLQKKA